MVRLNGEIKQSHLGDFLAKHYGQTVSRDDFNAAVAAPMENRTSRRLS
jgi:ribonuclease I